MVYSDYNYSTLAYLAGAECTYIDGNMLDGLYHTVDLSLFENALKSMVGK
jgi:hypothetical protein